MSTAGARLQIAARHRLGPLRDQRERREDAPRVERHQDPDQHGEPGEHDQEPDRQPLALARRVEQHVHAILNAQLEPAQAAQALRATRHELVADALRRRLIVAIEGLEKTREALRVSLQEDLELTRLTHQLDAHATRAVVAGSVEGAVDRGLHLGEHFGAPDAEREVEPDADVRRVLGRRDVVQLGVPGVLLGDQIAHGEREREVAGAHQVRLGGGARCASTLQPAASANAIKIIT